MGTHVSGLSQCASPSRDGLVPKSGDRTETHTDSRGESVWPRNTAVFGLVLLVNAPTMAMSTSLAHNEVLQCKRVLTIRLRQAVGSDTAVRPPAASPPFAQVNIIASNNIRVSECSRSRCVKLSWLNLRQQRARIQFRGGVARTTRFQHVPRVQRRRRSGMHQYPVRCA